MNTEIDRILGNALRRRRRLLHLTQQDLGNAVGVTAQQIQKYETGECRMNAARLWELASGLGVSVDYFFDLLGRP